MATVGERLATIEAGVRELREAVEDLRTIYNGGPGIDYDHSVRGRLHAIEGTLAGIVLRRSFGIGMLKGWQGTILVLCGIATAAAAWYAALGG